MRFRLPDINILTRWVEEHSLTVAAIRWAKTHSLPGFLGVPLWDVLVFLYNESKRGTLFARANAMAYSFFLSLFPAIIFLFTVATLLPIYATFEAEINGYIDIVMPTAAGKELQETIKELVKPNSSLLSVGFVLALYFSSNGMLSMMQGFEKMHPQTFRVRSGFRKRVMALLLTLEMGLLLGASVLLIVLGEIVIGWLAQVFRLTHAGEVGIKVFRWLVILLLFYFGVALIYRYGTALHVRFKWITPGATLTTLLSLVSSVAFSFYVNSFGTYNQVYGSIGTIIVLMLWIQINCFILQVGFELNASIAINRDLKAKVPEEE